MRTSETINELATALALAQTKIKNAPLNKENPAFKNTRYADLAAIRDTVMPALAEVGLSVVQGFDVVDGKACFVTRLMHKNGQWIESTLPFAADLSQPQKAGSAITYFRRYLLAAMAGIAAEEDDDANAASEPRRPPANANTGTPFDPEPDPDKYVEGALAIIEQQPSLAFAKSWWNEQADKRRAMGLTQGHVDVLLARMSEKFKDEIASGKKEAA